MEFSSPMAGISSSARCDFRVVGFFQQSPAGFFPQSFHHFGESECLPLLQRAGLDAQQARLLRAVQIQAARLVAVPHAKRDDLARSFISGAVQPVKIPARLAVQIIRDRQRGFADEFKSARAGGAFGGVLVRVQPERAHRRDQKRAARQQTDRRQTPLAPPRAAAQSQPANGQPPWSARRAPARPATPPPFPARRSTPARPRRKNSPPKFCRPSPPSTPPIPTPTRPQISGHPRHLATFPSSALHPPSSLPALLPPEIPARAGAPVCATSSRWSPPPPPRWRTGPVSSVSAGRMIPQRGTVHRAFARPWSIRAASPSRKKFRRPCRRFPRPAPAPRLRRSNNFRTWRGRNPSASSVPVSVARSSSPN